MSNGANPNISEVGERRDGNTTRLTPLQKASSCCLNKVKLLVEAGANIDQVNEFNGGALSSVLYGSCEEQTKILRYLVIEKGADINLPILEIQGGKKLYIENGLRYWRFPIGSNDHKVKMEIVDYLKERGRDYHKAKIPNKYYSRYDEEYLSKY